MSPAYKKKKPDTLDTLRLSEDAAESILDRRDVEGHSPNGCENRRSTRHSYRTKTGLVVTVYHPGGSIMRYAVAPRDLSTTGVGFLHGSYLHTGTNCVVSLPTLSSQWVNAVGQVVRCIHVQGKIHEIGVLFRDPIDTGQFVIAAAEQQEPAPNDGSELPRLVGRVLCIENSVDDRDLIRFMLDRLDVKVLMTNDKAETLAMFDGGVTFDMVMSAHDQHTLDGLGLIKALRAKGCDLPAVLLTAEEDQRIHAEALAHGCNAVLTKPFDLYELSGVLLQHLSLAEVLIEDTDSSALHSSLWSDEQMRPLIMMYLENLSTHIRQLQGLLADEERTVAFETKCLQIKGNAGGYGYPRISHAAQHLLTLSRANGSAEKVQRQCQALASLCERACRVREQG